MKQSAKQTNAPRLARPLLLALALSLTGCAASFPQAQVHLPARPELSQQIPQESYSQSVHRLLQTWRAKLTGTQQTH